MPNFLKKSCAWLQRNKELMILFEIIISIVVLNIALFIGFSSKATLAGYIVLFLIVGVAMLLGSIMLYQKVRDTPAGELELKESQKDKILELIREEKRLNRLVINDEEPSGCEPHAYLVLRSARNAKQKEEALLIKGKPIHKYLRRKQLNAIFASDETVEVIGFLDEQAAELLDFYMHEKEYDKHVQKTMIMQRNTWWKALLALTPALIILTLFMFFPIINTTIISFMEQFRFVQGGGIFAFNHFAGSIGFGAYERLFTDPTFIAAIKNTAIMVVVSVPITVIIALLIAVCLNSIKKLQGIFQTIFFLPYVTNTIALGMVFNMIFGTSSGLLNQIFGTNIAWLTDGTQAGYWKVLFVITIYTVWQGLAFKILVLMSGLQSIDKQYYDAAKIDGASKARILRRITIPLVSPMLAYTIITSFIGAFKAYTSVIALFGNGDTFGPPGNPNMWITIVGYVKQLIPQLNNLGKVAEASAGSIILLGIILFITLIELWISKKKVHF